MDATIEVYVASLQRNVVSVIGGAENGVVATISVPSRLFALAVNPATNTIYVRSQRKVFVINGATNKITASISNVSEMGGIEEPPEPNQKDQQLDYRLQRIHLAYGDRLGTDWARR